jgi:hypothetical protein
MITAHPLLVFALKVALAIPFASVMTVRGVVISPYVVSVTAKVTGTDGIAPDDSFLATTVISEISFPFATIHSGIESIVDAASAISAETIPMRRKSPSRINSPVFARISNTLEKDDVLAKYIKLFILKCALIFVRFKKYAFYIGRFNVSPPRPQAFVFPVWDIPGRDPLRCIPHQNI